MTRATSPAIVVLDGHTLNPDGDNPWDEIAALGPLTLHPRTQPADIIARAAAADIILTNKTPLTAATLAALPRLRFISVLATGHNIVDSAAARARGIPVANVPTYGTTTVAQHTLALILELCHHTGLHSRTVHDGEWSACPDFCYWKKPLVELDGLTLGIVGRGRIGQRVAALARAFGMRIQFASTNEPAGNNNDLVPLDALLATSDIITLHCVLTPANTRFINRATLARMKPGAFLINTGRGALIDEPALRSALDNGHLGGAALDVLDGEPPAATHPLLGAPNCIITPHMAWSGRRARQRLMQVTAANIRAFLNGTPENIVN
ncbi:D-2-hydroxyacid dehydrogenase [Opitutaceae bacterium TAV4]|nr:D-2-hydroxyacid dehydrogenase [Opitutaceae bacterium TAV4]RRJ99338.1 D-2-hydroxyacid dehydrogenase [Opitutaceae bacterium TAV3]